MTRFNFILEIPCSMPIGLRHVTIDTEHAYYGDVVQFMCRPGYSFPDNALVHSAECLDDGSWSSGVTNCQLGTRRDEAVTIIK